MGDGIPDVDRCEDITILDAVLLPSKWKKDCPMAWIMDIEADVDDRSDNEGDDSSESKSDDDDKSELESELESQSDESSNEELD